MISNVYNVYQHHTLYPHTTLTTMTTASQLLSHPHTDTSTQVNGQNKTNGNTALHYAVQQNMGSMIKLLYSAKKQKCRSDIRNKEHKTARDVARQQGGASGKQLLQLINSYENKSNGKGVTVEDALTAALMDDNDTTKGGPGMTRDYSHDGMGGSSFGMGLDTESLQRYDMSASHSGAPNNYSDSSRDSSIIPGGALGDKISNEIVVMSGFVEKKRHKSPHIWQRRWVMLNRQCMLWSDKKLKIRDHADERFVCCHLLLFLSHFLCLHITRFCLLSYFNNAL